MMYTRNAFLPDRFLRDRGGNFALMTALILPVLVGAAGVALDVSNMMLSKSDLQEATDAAALAAATALANGTTDTSGAPQLAKDFVAGQMAASLKNDSTALDAIKTGTTADVKQTTTSTGNSFAVTVTTNYSMQLSGFTSLLGWSNARLRATSSTTSGTSQTGTALSMILALDESGSMADNTDTAVQTCVLMLLNQCLLYGTTYVTKIAALKQAAATLFDTLDKADPKQVLVRTGAISYNNGIVGQTKSPTMNWGTTAARKYVTNMPTKPTGGTDATTTMAAADTAVKKSPDGTDTETIAQAQKGNKTSDRYIVLMTDGEMTGNSTVWNKTLDKSVRDGCDLAKSDGITIFTVAFMAPANGKALLQYCASSAGNYYEPDTMDNLVSAFKSIAQTATSSGTLLTN
jgi:Flp pilus assembly protein TadG